MTSHAQAPVRNYGFGTILVLPYEQAVEPTKAALNEGFGVLTEIEVKQTMKDKLWPPGCLRLPHA